MASNNFTLNVNAQLSTPAGIVPIAFNLSVTQTGTAFERRLLTVQSEADGWTQFTKPTEMGDVYCMIVFNPATTPAGVAHLGVNYALTAAATYQPSEIPPGGGIILFNPAPTELYFSQLGLTSTTQDVEIFTLET